jgi:hypothetical protein
MAVQTALIDPDGKLRQLRWGWWHVSVLSEAMQEEDPNEDRSFPKEGTYTYTREHTFIDESDGEVLVIPVGAKYEAWR